MRPLPGNLASLFHRQDPSTIDLDRHAGLVIRTVLAEGDWDQVRWLFREYGWERIRQVVVADHQGLRALPEPTRRLWLAVFAETPQAQAGEGESSDPIERWACRRLPPGARPRPG
ncbi:DUF6922 domain-containing protein [Geochorda subterranea]|uniref:DUF6922 domain-containing protein n=1 Tax=Geochorda subterranea TaxID=3109564 RepID=A0ABZ1BP20_9FIRM|nr:hypothetical protein [Limnochorda sp. LNt]WRP14561.1 hypothetical protein VLY81_14280 [Limnochorda sp. LNt]